MKPAAQRQEKPTAGAGFNANRAMAEWMQEIVPYGIFTTDRELCVTSWNDWLVGHSGFTAHEVVGRRLPEIFPDLEGRRLLDKYARALDGEISVLSAALHKYLLPLPVTVPESGLSHMLQTARIAPLPQAGGIAGTITIIEDVTQREFQASVLSRQQELDRLLSTALAALLQAEDPVREMGGIFASVRLALGLDVYASYLVGAEEKQLQLVSSVGLSPKQREAVSMLPLSAEGHSDLQRASLPSALDISAHRQMFRNLELRSLGSFPLTVGDRVIGLVVFGSYVREAIADADSNVLARIARYVAIALDRARRERETVEASQAKDDFLAALSHELRTPLNPVLLVASDAMDNPKFPDEARAAFRVIEKNALLEARLIDDLLDLTRIAHGKLGLDAQPLDVHAVLRDAVETVRAELEEQKLSLEVNVGAEALPVLGDTGRLQQVFWNILKNAVKFTPRGGRIRVSSVVNSAANEVSVKIADTGIGMDAAELGRVFEAFAQGDHAHQGRSHRFGGLGLGLAISRKLMELHGGKIEASSGGKGLGSTFTLTLPLTRKAMPSETVAVSNVSTVRPTPTDSPKPGDARILLVEDHEPTRLTLAQLLTRRGFEVAAVASMEGALRTANAGRFDLVLSDIGLPDGDGFTLMRMLREQHGLKGIALTGYGMEEDLVRSSDAGFLTHLTKPISVKVLDRALAEIFPARRT